MHFGTELPVIVVEHKVQHSSVHKDVKLVQQILNVETDWVIVQERFRRELGAYKIRTLGSGLWIAELKERYVRDRATDRADGESGSPSQSVEEPLQETRVKLVSVNGNLGCSTV